MKNLIESLKRCIYLEMQRSIFVKHKLLFSLMLTLTCIELNGGYSPEDMKFLLSGLPTTKPSEVVNPMPSSISKLVWDGILNLSTLKSTASLAATVVAHPKEYSEFIDKMGSLSLAEYPSYVRSLSGFSRLVLTRIIRPDLFVEQVRTFISNEMGSYFISNLLITLNDCYVESAPHIPLIFVLSPGKYQTTSFELTSLGVGDDPQDDLKKFSSEKGKYITFVSLGKGQGEFAETNIREAMHAGQWCLL